MRIDLNSILLNATERDDKTRNAGSKAPSAPSAPTAPSVEDKTSLSVDTLSISSLEAQAMTTPQIRQDKVEALRQSVQNGDYKVEPDKIARAILEHNQR